MRQLRELLSRIGQAVRIDPNRRRLDVLRTFVDIVRVGCSFVRATSGLARIGKWATAMFRSPAHARIVQLLAYEDGAAELDLRVRLGYDGRIRDLVVVGAGAVAAVVHADRLDDLREDAGRDFGAGVVEAAEAVRETWRALEEFNLNPSLALEALFVRLRRALAPAGAAARA